MTLPAVYISYRWLRNSSIWHINCIPMPCEWVSLSPVWDKPCACVCYLYDLTRVYLFHYCYVTCASPRLKSSATRLFVHVLVLPGNKEPPKDPYTGPQARATPSWWTHNKCYPHSLLPGIEYSRHVTPWAISGVPHYRLKSIKVSSLITSRTLPKKRHA